MRTSWQCANASEQNWGPLRDTGARIGIGLSLALGALFQAITFVPGASAGFFGFAAALAAVGLIARHLRMQILSNVLAIWFLAQAYAGYQHGLSYQEHWRQLKREIRKPSVAPTAPTTTP